MKLAEALLARKDLEKEIANIEGEIAAVVVRAENSPKVDINVEEKLKELEEKYRELHDLNIAILITNAKHTIDIIEQIKILDKQIAFWNTVKRKYFDYLDDDVKYEVNLDFKFASEKLNNLIKARRILDKELQKKNWQIDLIEAPKSNS